MEVMSDEMIEETVQINHEENRSIPLMIMTVRMSITQTVQLTMRMAHA